MKKLMTLALITALSMATVAEAKRGGGFKMAKSKPQTSQQRKPDADFNNTPNAMQNNAAAQAQNGNRMGNFVTGAAAGYLLSNALSPTEAQAQEQTATQAVSSETKSATANVQKFKQLDPTDPNMIERNANYARYCLAGVQYIVSGSKVMALVDSQNQPQRCIIEP